MSSAAAILAVPQPAISRLIGRIERTAGLSLFARTANGVSLTRAGQVFLKNAERALHFHDLAYTELQDIRGKLVGEVRIAAPESVSDNLFAPLIEHFQASRPDAFIRTIAASRPSIPPMLDVIDIGIVANTHPQPTGPSEELCTENFYLIGKEGAAEVRQTRIGPPDCNAGRIPHVDR